MVVGLKYPQPTSRDLALVEVNRHMTGRAGLTGRLAGEFLGAAVIYMVVFWALLSAAAWVVGRVRVQKG